MESELPPPNQDGKTAPLTRTYLLASPWDLSHFVGNKN